MDAPATDRHGLALWARTPTGLERELCREVLGLLGERADAGAAEVKDGNVVVPLRESCKVGAAEVLRLRCAEKVLVRLLKATDDALSSTDKESALLAVERLVGSIAAPAWESALEMRLDFACQVSSGGKASAGQRAGAAATLPRPRLDVAAGPLFQVKGKRTGTHQFDSTEMRKAAYKAIKATNPRWEGVYKGAEVDVDLAVSDSTIQVGMLITSVELWQHTMLQYPRELVSTPLKPIHAFGLAKLTQPQTGDLLIDPVAGSGTILEVAARELPERLFCLGGDVDPDNVAKVAHNAAACGRGGYIDAVVWDATRLPLRDGVVDRIAADMPFGKRCGNKASNRKLYSAAVREFLRVMRRDGQRSATSRCDLLSADMGAIVSVLKNKQLRYSLKLHRQARMHIGGLTARLLEFSPLHCDAGQARQEAPCAAPDRRERAAKRPREQAPSAAD